MKDVLSKASASHLAAMAGSRVMIGLDYDGTLSPIVANPLRAGLRKRTQERLRALCALYPVVAISGRARADVMARVAGLGVREVIGNHGIEPWGHSRQVRAQVKRWLPVVLRRLAEVEGVVLEDKTYSIALHYRASRQRPKARAAIMEVVEGLEGVRIIGGKLVINVVPEGAPNKGIALVQARKKLRCETAIYVGDDDTDEDVFRLDQPQQLLSVRVGLKRSSAAGYYLRDQLAIDRFLGALVELRKARGARAEGGHGRGRDPGGDARARRR